MSTLMVRILCLGIALAGAETLHGVARTMLVAPWLGAIRARRLSIISGTLIAFTICWFLVPWLGIHDGLLLTVVGLLLAGFMAAFDIILAHWVIGQKWPTVFNDFKIWRGNLLVVGLALLAAMPTVVVALRSP